MEYSVLVNDNVFSIKESEDIIKKFKVDLFNMVMCFAPNCRHYSEKKTCKFFVFPADPSERKRWINLIRRDKAPSKHSVVCSCHFLNMERKNRPTIFEFNVKRKCNFESTEIHKTRIKTESGADHESTDNDEGAGLSEPFSARTTHETTSRSASTSDDDVGSSLVTENIILKQELKETTNKLKNLTSNFSYEHIKNNDSQVLMYTGLPTSALFMLIYETIDSFEIKYYAGWQVKVLPKVDQLLMTLMKLRLNMPHEDLAIRFNCRSTTVTNIVMTWIYTLHEVFFKQLMKTIPSRQKSQASLPAVFSNFKNCRIILDWTEIPLAMPSSLDSQQLTNSSHKHRNTWKILVGVAPNGVITFVSKAYPGLTSDKKIVEHSEVLKQMVPGDLILAEKGVLFKDLLPAGVSLNISPSLSTPQLTEFESQVYETERISKAKILVEGAIRRIKCFNILQQVPQHYISQISIIFQLCAALANFQCPLIKEVEEYYV